MGLPNQYLKWISELQAIAQSGLTYTKNPFDKERFIRMREIVAELSAEFTAHGADEIKEIFSLETGYATPKLDVRTFVLQEDKILLVREKMDGLWTLPGGWMDVNESPSEAAVRETEEESGFSIRLIKLLALWDKLKHDHPPQWPHAYKCIFWGEIISNKPIHPDNIEILDVDFFDKEALPPLSLHRITASQLHRLHDLVKSNAPTQFD